MMYMRMLSYEHLVVWTLDHTSAPVWIHKLNFERCTIGFA